jgi:hypothetical protein
MGLISDGSSLVFPSEDGPTADSILSVRSAHDDQAKWTVAIFGAISNDFLAEFRPRAPVEMPAGTTRREPLEGGTR